MSACPLVSVGDPQDLTPSQVSMDTHAEVLTGAGSGGGLDALRPPPSARAREQLLAGFTWAPCEQPPRGVASCAAELHMFSRSTCSTFFPLKEAKQPADSLGCESSSSDLRIL